MEDAHQTKKNSTDYPLRVKQLVRRALDEHADATKRGLSEIARLRYYQYVTRQIVTNPDFGIGLPGNSRGVVVYHPMGAGKTNTAITPAIVMLLEAYQHRKRMKIGVFLSKSLQSNFQNSILKLIKMLYLPADEKVYSLLAEQVATAFKYVALDAFNAPKQMLERIGSLDGTLVIVDEAHEFFRAIINSKDDDSNARKLYHAIMRARGVRLIFLTGTPLGKSVFELVPMANMLMGEIILPVQYDVFMGMYVDQKAGKLKNVAKLADRLLGMVSYVKLDAGKARSVGGMPEVKPLRVEHVEMSERQYARYLAVRDIENKEIMAASKVKKLSSAMSLPSTEGAAGSFHVKSRMLVNFCPREKYDTVAEIPDDEFTPENSPKIMRFMALMTEYGKFPALGYSSFVELGGVKVMARYLDLAGWRRFNPAAVEPSEIKGADEKTTDPAKTDQKPAPKADMGVYAIYTGETSLEERDAIQRVYNSPENKNGVKIKLLLVSKPGSRGLDLFRTRQEHLLETYWYLSQNNQIIARGARLGSHDDLPEEDRDVQPFLYIADANKRVYAELKGEREPITIDEQFYRKAIRIEGLNVQGRALLRSVSIECAAYGYENCYTCEPTGEELYHGAPEVDRAPSVCRRRREVEARPFEHKKMRFHYTIERKPDGTEEYNLFRFVPEMDASMPVTVTDEDYPEILSAAKEANGKIVSRK